MDSWLIQYWGTYNNSLLCLTSHITSACIPYESTSRHGRYTEVHWTVSATFTVTIWGFRKHRCYCIIPPTCLQSCLFAFTCELEAAISEILKPPCLAPTIIPRSKSLRSHFFPILTFGLKNRWTSWPCLLAFMHLVAATRLADFAYYILFALTSYCIGLPNKLITECTDSSIYCLAINPCIW